MQTLMQDLTPWFLLKRVAFFDHHAFDVSPGAVALRIGHGVRCQAGRVAMAARVIRMAFMAGSSEEWAVDASTRCINKA